VKGEAEVTNAGIGYTGGLDRLKILHEQDSMGTVYEDIILKNAWDVINVKHGLIPEHQVRIAAGTLVISEAIHQKCGQHLTRRHPPGRHGPHRGPQSTETYRLSCAG
jgi:hypothetical protein